LQQESAEGIAQEVLIWIAGEEDLLAAFMGSTGAAGSDLKNAAQDPAFLASVLDFLMMDDAWIARFCAASGHAPDTPGHARRALPGGAEVHWT